MTKSAAFFAVRVADRPRRAALGRRLPADRGQRPARAACSTPSSPAAVAAGNVETSSRVADLVIAALAGARAGPRPGPGDDEQPDPRRTRTSPTTRRSAAARAPARTPTGPSAIHVAMSNTLNTPVEALETEFPLRVRELSLRRGSGGAGRAPRRRRDRARDRGAGADALHADHRAPPPPAARPRRRRRRRSRAATLLNGEPLPGKAEGELEPGDGLRIETPGGGGYGPSVAIAAQLD